MRILPLLFLAAAASSGASAAPRQSLQERGEAQLAKELQGRVAGKPQQCLTASDTEGSHIIDGTAIVYSAPGGRLYVNHPQGAEMLREDDIPVQMIYGSQLCRLDQVRLIDRSSHFLRGSVSLGDFVPYDRPRTVRQREK